MNKQTLLVTPFITLLILGSSSIAMASGSHDGGHDNKNKHDMSKMQENAHWMAPAHDAKQKNPVPSTHDSIAAGKALYQTNCASCHGKSGIGDGMAGMMLKPKPANLKQMSGTHPDGDFAYKIREGRGAMPAWGKIMSEKEIWQVVNYVQNLKNEEGDAGDAGHHSDGSSH